MFSVMLVVMRKHGPICSRMGALNQALTAYIFTACIGWALFELPNGLFTVNRRHFLGYWGEEVELCCGDHQLLPQGVWIISSCHRVD